MALELFSGQGYQGTTMEQIAAGVRIARTTLYEYYKSKEDILFSLIDEVVEEPRSKPLEGSVREQLETLAAESISRLLNNYMLYKILFQELPTLGHPTADRIRAWQSHSLSLAIQIVATGFSEGVFLQGFTKEDVFFAYRALLGQRLGDLLLSETQVVPEEEAERLVNLLWLGVGHKRS